MSGRRSRPPVPACRQIIPFLRHHHGPQVLAPCTGQDHAALAAFAHLVELHGRSDTNGRLAAITGMRALVAIGMQPKIGPIVKASIPAILDWGDEETIWQQVADVTPFTLAAPAPFVAAALAAARTLLDGFSLSNGPGSADGAALVEQFIAWMPGVR